MTLIPRVSAEVSRPLIKYLPTSPDQAAKVSEALKEASREPVSLESLINGWAGIILAGSSFLELSDEFETTSEGDVLLNALWDATFGDEIDQNAVRVAEGLVESGRSL